MELKLERIGAWCGIAMLVFFGLGVGLIGKMIMPTPVSPTLDAAQIAQFFVENKARIRLGMVVCVLGLGTALPFMAVLCIRIRRVEGRWGMLAITQLLGAATVYPIFAIPMVIWAAAAFRPDTRPPEITQALSDFGWLLLVSPAGPAVVQFGILAVACFVDRTEPRTFPRWFGWLNVWVTLGSFPSVAVLAFNEGPLSWNGVIALWIPLMVFLVWLIATATVILKSITAEEASLQRQPLHT